MLPIQRLKDDEIRFLQALRSGTFESARLSPARRLALQGQFERKGWSENGKLTSLGLSLAEKNPEREQPQADESNRVADRRPAMSDGVSIDEGQTNGDIDVQGQARQVVDNHSGSGVAEHREGT